MLKSFTSSVAGKLLWVLTGTSVLVAIFALSLANHYRTEAVNLTAQLLSESAKAEQSYLSLFALLEKEREVASEKFSELERANRALLAQRDGLHDKLASLQAELDSTTAEDCCRRSKAFVGFSDRAFDIAARCTAELGRKQQALESCVRSYEGVKIVNDSAQ